MAKTYGDGWGTQHPSTGLAETPMAFGRNIDLDASADRCCGSLGWLRFLGCIVKLWVVGKAMGHWLSRAFCKHPQGMTGWDGVCFQTPWHTCCRGGAMGGEWLMGTRKNGIIRHFLLHKFWLFKGSNRGQ